MGLTSLQVCMDPADWLQGTMEDQSGLIMDSPSLSSGGGGGGGDMLAVVCSRPAAALMERHLRPPHDQALKCPRCESTHTKFCYYNNYSLTQPRYFCKTCRRYWTKGGTLRNIPVGGGCRKSKKSSSSKNNNNNKSNSSSATSSPSSSSHHNHYHHHDQLVMNHHTNNGNHFNSLLLGNHMAAAGTGSSGGGGNHMTNSIMMNNVMEPIDFLESKLEAIVGSSRNHSNYDFMGNNGGSNINDHQSLGLGGLSGNFHGMSSCSPPFGLSIDGAGGESSNNNYATVAAGMSFMETCQRLMLPYDYDHHNNNNNNNNNNVEGDDHDLKPTTAKLLSLDNTWQDYHHHHHDHEPAAANKETTTTGFAYLNGSWHNNGTSSTAAATTSTSTAAAVNHHHHLMMNGYNGSTITTNPLL